MKTAKVRCSSVCFIFLFFLTGYHAFPSHFWGSLTMGLMTPTGEFGDTIGHEIRMVPGLSFGYKSDKLPFVFEISLEYSRYGKEKRYQDIYIPEFGNLLLDIHTAHSLFRSMLKIKFLPSKKGSVRPYMDFMAGLNFLRSSVYIPGEYDDRNDSYSNIANRTLSKDTKLFYGLGTGILIRVWGDKYKNQPGWSCQHFLSIGFNLSSGEPAVYMKKGSTTIHDNEAYFTTYTTKINTLNFRIGYTIAFL